MAMKANFIIQQEITRGTNFYLFYFIFDVNKKKVVSHRPKKKVHFFCLGNFVGVLTLVRMK
jgi:hypothetical protein